MTADAVHSFSDLATDVVVIAFARISAKPRDAGHDYGHGKYETLATLLISLALAAVGAGILLSAVRSIRAVAEGVVLPRRGPSRWSLPGCRSSSRRYSTAIRSVRGGASAARASWRTPGITVCDALSSLGTLAGIGCAYFWARGGASPIRSPRSSSRRSSSGSPSD